MPPVGCVRFGVMSRKEAPFRPKGGRTYVAAGLLNACGDALLVNEDELAPLFGTCFVTEGFNEITVDC